MPYRRYLSEIDEILEDVRKGKMIILVDEEDRENEGDLVIPSELADAEAVNFMAKHGRGLICLALTNSRVQELGLPLLENRLGGGEISELIIATNPTVEGDATAHYLADMAEQHNVQASRIAHGVPLGGELEYVDGGTLSHAFYGRRVVE